MELTCFLYMYNYSISKQRAVLCLKEKYNCDKFFIKNPHQHLPDFVKSCRIQFSDHLCVGYGYLS